MISTKKLFEMIESFLFAFDSKEKVIKEIFNNDIESYTIMPKEEIEKKVYEELSNYFRKQFEEEKLVEIVQKYIKSKEKKLTKKDIAFIDNVIIESNYDVTFEDIERLLELKEICTYLKSAKNDQTSIVEKIKEFQDLKELEIEEDNQVRKQYDYEGEDIQKKYFSDISKFRLLTAEEERYYLKKYKEEKDPDAYETLVGANQGLCIQIAGHYRNRGLSFLDLIQEGNVGLMIAIDKFDLNKNTKLSTYATWWIEKIMKKALNEQGNTIRIPLYIINKLEKISRIEKEFRNTNNREPTIKELSELSGFSVKTIEEIRQADIPMLYMDKTIDNGEDNNSTIKDFIEDDNTVLTPEKLADKQGEHDAYEFLIKTLYEEKTIKNPFRTEQIIRLRMGIEMYNEETYRILKKANYPINDLYKLEEVGKIFGITRERVRQLQEIAITKMTLNAKKYNVDIFENENYKELVKKKKIKETKK